MVLLLTIASLLILGAVLILVYSLFRQKNQDQSILNQLLKLSEQQEKTLQTWSVRFDERSEQHQKMIDTVLNLLNQQQQHQQEQRTQFDQHQFNTLKTLQDSLQTGMTSVRQHVSEALQQMSESLNQRVEKLNQSNDSRLKEISGQVEKRLSEGFEKTTATFTDVIKRLTIIDEAQKKITELSSNVVSLQEVLVDKRSRGAFGEVQLMGLIRNVMPETSFAFQYTLPNDMRADCILFLPAPTGNVVIDSKFPLESYRQIIDNNLTPSERKTAEQTFRRDIRNHIDNISKKYIIQGETSDGAMMFIPAEAVFAEIHAHYPDLVEHAQKNRVWMVSPTTMMAILTTARAVLKDAATRKQVHIIQEHLAMLSKDFSRFEKRMNSLKQHIKQVHDDVEDVHTSSNKITSRFSKIEKVELQENAEASLLDVVEE